jgi:hypothetical protein
MKDRFIGPRSRRSFCVVAACALMASAVAARADYTFTGLPFQRRLDGIRQLARQFGPAEQYLVRRRL